MSPTLPPEILDLIADHLIGEPATLRACSLVSKSWISRTRRHLFNSVRFYSHASHLESWVKAFPDPSSSLAHYTRSLHFECIEAVTCATSNAHSWLRSFNRVVDLRLVTFGADDHRISFTQLHGISPVLRSLHLYYFLASPSEVLNFICSFPLLEDLALHSSREPVRGNADQWDAPSTSPRFTGFLLLNDNDPRITRMLLDLPGGLRFSKVSVSCPSEDGDLAKQLVSTCSNTLESLQIHIYATWRVRGVEPSFDLTKATELKDVKFQQYGSKVGWINATLQTAKSKNLRQITIHFRSTYMLEDEKTRPEWQDLDHLLVQLWTTRSTDIVFIFRREDVGEGVRVLAQKLLPEVTSRATVSSA